jgi:hypothetical protein
VSRESSRRLSSSFPFGGRVCLPQGHRPHRGLIRRRHPSPPLPRWRSPAQLLPTHHGDYPNSPRQHPDGRTTERNEAPGKSHPAALRCRKRRLSDAVCRRLPPRAPPTRSLGSGAWTIGIGPGRFGIPMQCCGTSTSSNQAQREALVRSTFRKSIANKPLQYEKV